MESQLAPRKKIPVYLSQSAKPKIPSKPLGFPTKPVSKSPDLLSLAEIPTQQAKQKISPVRPRCLRSPKMTKPEIAFNRDFLDGCGLFEAVTLKLPGGSNYTADFLALLDGQPCLVECKGSYRLQSEGRAHTAFFEAAANFPMFKFIWAVYEKGGKWNIKHVIPASSPDNIMSFKSSCVSSSVCNADHDIHSSSSDSLSSSRILSS